MPIRSNVLAILKQADLVGEEMLKFRHGEELYPYCSDCAHSAFTPVTNILGCKIGDDAEVVEFSNGVYEDESLLDKEKCPGFTPRSEEGELGFQNEAALSDAEANKLNKATADQVTQVVKRIFGDDFSASARAGYKQITRTFKDSLAIDSVRGDSWVDVMFQAKNKWGDLAKRVTSDHKNSGSMVKEVPSEEVDTLQGPKDRVARETLEESKAKDEAYFPWNGNQKYDYTGDVKQAAINDEPQPAAGLEELYQFLDQAGVKEVPPNQQYDMVADALRQWQDGVMAPHLTHELVTDTLEGYLTR